MGLTDIGIHIEGGFAPAVNLRGIKIHPTLEPLDKEIGTELDRKVQNVLQS